MRPEGWENPHKAKEKVLEFPNSNNPIKELSYDFTRHADFEAGADAMLEGLKRHGVYKTMPEVKYYSEIYGSGWLVFIPEEG